MESPCENQVRAKNLVSNLWQSMQIYHQYNLNRMIFNGIFSQFAGDIGSGDKWLTYSWHQAVKKQCWGMWAIYIYQGKIALDVTILHFLFNRVIL